MIILNRNSPTNFSQDIDSTVDLKRAEKVRALLKVGLIK